MVKTYKDQNGYIRFKDSDKYVHKWVAEGKYGSLAIDGKEIHHIDGDKTNNDKSNLILLSKEDHWLLSLYERRNKFIISIIIGLSLFYIIVVNLLNYTLILNKEIASAFARVAVFFVLLLALELKYHWLGKWIRKPSG